MRSVGLTGGSFVVYLCQAIVSFTTSETETRPSPQPDFPMDEALDVIGREKVQINAGNAHYSCPPLDGRLIAFAVA